MNCLLIAVLSVLAAASATDVDQCPGLTIPDLRARSRLVPCKRLPCRLRHKTDTHIELEFVPDHDIKRLYNEVNAEVLGLPLPFVGVDGKSVCDKIYLADDPSTPAPCPLKAGTKYVYKDSFPVLEIYPQISTKIHWGLKSNNKYVTCFEVPAKIVK